MAAYFLRGEDGRTYGPADTETLRRWAREGRLLRESLLTEETGVRVVRAGGLPELEGYWPPPGSSCPNCRHSVAVGLAFCPICGASQVNGPVWPPAPQGQPIPMPMPPRRRWLTRAFVLGVVTGWLWSGLCMTVAASCLSTSAGDAWAAVGWVCAFGGHVGGYFALRRRYPDFARGLLLSLPFGFLVSLIVGILFLLGALAVCVVSGAMRQ